MPDEIKIHNHYWTKDEILNLFQNKIDNRINEVYNSDIIQDMINNEFAKKSDLEGFGNFNVIDNLTSDSTTDALSAKQGKELKTSIDSVQNNVTTIQNNVSTIQNIANKINSTEPRGPKWSLDSGYYSGDWIEMKRNGFGVLFINLRTDGPQVQFLNSVVPGFILNSPTYLGQLDSSMRTKFTFEAPIKLYGASPTGHVNTGTIQIINETNVDVASVYLFHDGNLMYNTGFIGLITYPLLNY